ncbi:26S proteasome non-ATPase regulatory subunit 9 [Cyclospora cayetanensis]|uniref:26S proteasome non-ATPase regulatory subunit 9 n=1 Tax=Cyclospora cayetanensis TaxID=88456 RepID=A0A6P6RVY0_9EIME|nr:26S proteasome non-ATPase regulatory subunit 9 [Cyclospora cayetanensis]
MATEVPPKCEAACSPAVEAEQMYQQRQMLEERMEAIASFLTSEGMPGLKGPLVDEEGFPRADIDVHAVRSARNQLACLQTDYREVQRKLEEILLRVHAESAKAQIDQQDLRAPKQPDTTEVAGEQDEVPPPPIEDEGPAFAVVDVLQPGGPSGIAGIAAGDRVLRLGTLRLPVGRNAAAGSTQNHRKGPLPGGDSSSRALTATQIFELLPGEVARYENERMPVVVQRGSRVISLWLVPRQWHGKGLLGCHIKPLQQE